MEPDAGKRIELACWESDRASRPGRREQDRPELERIISCGRAQVERGHT
jgi:hypothetical protein